MGLMNFNLLFFVIYKKLDMKDNAAAEDSAGISPNDKLYKLFVSKKIIE